MTRHVSISEFAQLYNLSDKTIRRRIKDGSLKEATQLGGPGTSWRIPFPLKSETSPPVSDTTSLPDVSTPAPRRHKARWNRASNF